MYFCYIYLSEHNNSLKNWIIFIHKIFYPSYEIAKKIKNKLFYILSEIIYYKDSKNNSHKIWIFLNKIHIENICATSNYWNY